MAFRSIIYNGLPSFFIPMLEDSDRNSKYELAIYQAINQFKHEQGRSPDVIDFGCGTGMLTIFALRHGAGTVTSVDRNKDMIIMCKEAIRRAKLSENNSKNWGTYQVYHGTFPVNERLHRSATWLLTEDGKYKKFDIIVSEIIGTLANSESMWRFLNYARPFLRTFDDDNKIYAIPQTTETTACFYEIKDLFGSESSGNNYPMQVALDSLSAFSSWKKQKKYEITAESDNQNLNNAKYLVTGELGLALYDMGFVAVTERKIISLQTFKSINLEQSIPKINEKLKFNFENGYVPGPCTFLVLEWTTRLWSNIMLGNTLYDYTKLSPRNRYNRNMHWGFFCNRPWLSIEPKTRIIYAQITKWETGIPFLRLIRE